MRLLKITLFLLLSTTLLLGQNTVGLTNYVPSQAFDGYNLHFPHNQGNVYLLDNCGEIVHVWADAVYKPGNGVEIHSDGNLYVCKGRNALSNSFIHAGGGGEKIEVRDWNNNILWSYTMNDSTQRFHHDMTVMPNGNILAIAWEYKSMADAIAAGRDTTKLTDGALWPEKIVELQPNLSTGTTTIVWEWHAWDHLVQNFDATKANFGVVATNPNKIDLNYTPYNTSADWLHANAIDYNPTLDQIVLSVPTFNEVWIIDHSTTTAQAAGSTGGLAGKGGDLIYRFGNPAAYGQTGAQLLFYQHDIHWADIGLPSTHPEFGKLVVFNNQAGADYSSAHTFSPVFDTYGWEYTMTGTAWGPTAFDWTYTAPTPQDMYSTGLSSAQILPNNNRLICVGRFGRSFEINSSNQIVWEYINPMKGGNPVAQGDTTITINANLQFRMKRYPTDFAGFNGKTFGQLGYIELNPDTVFCANVLNVTSIDTELDAVSVFPNPIAGQSSFSIQFEDYKATARRIEIFDLYGRLLYTQLSNEQTENISVIDWKAGLYVLRIDGRTSAKLSIMK